MLHVVDGIDDVIELGKVKFLKTSSSDQIVYRVAFAVRIDLQNTLSEGFDFTSPYGVGQGMNLAVGVSNIDIIVINQANATDPTKIEIGDLTQTHKRANSRRTIERSSFILPGFGMAHRTIKRWIDSLLG